MRVVLNFFTDDKVISFLSRFVLIAIIVGNINTIVSPLLKEGETLVSKFSITTREYVLSFICLVLLIELVLLFKRHSQSPQPAETGHAPESFGKAVLAYIAYLKSVKKHSMILDLRSKLSHFFHLVGQNRVREEVGKIALEAAAIQSNNLQRGQILMDDLGWAIFLQDRKPEALKNIKRSLTILDDAQANTPKEKLEITLAKAKASRHLAFLSNSKTETDKHLANCETEINALKKKKTIYSSFPNRIKCDEAQFWHAKSYLAVMALGVVERGKIDLDDTSASDSLKEALTDIDKAVSMFDEINDLERKTKALVLKARIHYALGEDLIGTETDAKRDMVLSSSGIEGVIASVSHTKLENLRK